MRWSDHMPSTWLSRYWVISLTATWKRDKVLWSCCQNTEEPECRRLWFPSFVYLSCSRDTVAPHEAVSSCGSLYLWRVLRAFGRKPCVHKDRNFSFSFLIMMRYRGASWGGGAMFSLCLRGLSSASAASRNMHARLTGDSKLSIMRECQCVCVCVGLCLLGSAPALLQTCTWMHGLWSDTGWCGKRHCCGCCCFLVYEPEKQIFERERACRAPAHSTLCEFSTTRCIRSSRRLLFIH